MEKLNQEREARTNSNSQMGGENPRKKSIPTASIECHYFIVVYTLPLKLELVPAILQSYSLTLYKVDTSLKQTEPRVGPIHSSVILTLYKAHTSLKQTPRVGPCCSPVNFFDSL